MRMPPMAASGALNHGLFGRGNVVKNKPEPAESRDEGGNNRRAENGHAGMPLWSNPASACPAVPRPSWPPISNTASISPAEGMAEKSTDDGEQQANQEADKIK